VVCGKRSRDISAKIGLVRGSCSVSVSGCMQTTWGGKRRFRFGATRGAPAMEEDDNAMAKAKRGEQGERRFAESEIGRRSCVLQRSRRLQWRKKRQRSPRLCAGDSHGSNGEGQQTLRIKRSGYHDLGTLRRDAPLHFQGLNSATYRNYLARGQGSRTRRRRLPKQRPALKRESTRICASAALQVENHL